MPEFGWLCEELHLTEQLEEPVQLEKLQQWWHSHVSTDVTFDNLSPRDQYDNYLKNTKKLLKKQFGTQSEIQYAAIHGYDRYLANINQSPNAFDIPDSHNMSPLHHASYKGFVETVTVLLAKGANPLTLNNNLQMPLYLALWVPSSKSDALSIRKQTIFNLLMEREPFALNHLDYKQNSVFNVMVANDKFNDLLEKYVSNPVAELPNDKGHYLIHEAILKGSIKNACTLLKFQQNTHAPIGSLRQTVAHYLASFGSENMVRRCIPYVAHVINDKNTNGAAPLDLALRRTDKYSDKVQSILIKHGAQALQPKYNNNIHVIYRTK